MPLSVSSSSSRSCSSSPNHSCMFPTSSPLPLTRLTLHHSIALGHWWSPGEPQRYAQHQWEGFGVVLATNLIGLLIIIFRRDVVWCAGATWLCAATFTQRPKPFSIYVRPLPHPLTLPHA